MFHLLESIDIEKLEPIIGDLPKKPKVDPLLEYSVTYRELIKERVNQKEDTQRLVDKVAKEFVERICQLLHDADCDRVRIGVHNYRLVYPPNTNQLPYLRYTDNGRNIHFSNILPPNGRLAHTPDYLKLLEDLLIESEVED